MKDLNVSVTTLVTHRYKGLFQFQSAVVQFDVMAFAAEGGKSPIFTSNLSSASEDTSVHLKVRALEMNFGITFSPDTWSRLVGENY